MLIGYTVILLLYLFPVIYGELISIIVGTGIAVGLGSFLFYNQCKVLECCEAPWIQIRHKELSNALRKRLYGQHIAINSIESLVAGHLRQIKEGKSKKSLVMSFHGWPGIGKTYTSAIIAEHIFEKGFSSKYVRRFFGSKDFPLPNRVNEYRDNIQKWIAGNLSECTKTLFIFDEVDKMSPKILDAISPYGQENVRINGKPANDAIYIFISNAGGDAIANKVRDFYLKKGFREDLKLEDFENIIKENAVNKGGLEESDMIFRGIVDVFVPFLPLEKKHVEECIETIFTERDYKNVEYNKEIKEYLLKHITFSPKNDPLFSINGCRLIEHKMNLISEKYYRKPEVDEI
ncbi:Torsin-like protein [Strongyloides ratti]|uniref:Torsin-like protein n=1 Tax=Strongyloides ratti TaxID=34506 RepID=A0A090LHB7_STRRB|nr:Torsin-like protein [Strongyloides ratti]CEF69172.1 Torsin-like protein [Strongyloides ratti]